jgi:RNA polymerase sigma factor (sigma-70 family)
MVASHVGLAYGIAGEFFLPGAEMQDVRQEALIALLDAIRCYDGSIPFASFARIVVRRKLISAITTARRPQRGPLDCLSLPETVADSRDWESASTVRHDLAVLVAALPRLSPLERRALADLLNGVAQTKQTDNAMTRVRAKLRLAS